MNAAERKTYPVYTGVIKYFPRALRAVSHVSYIGSQQHNPGKPAFWDRGVSEDHEDCLVRHLIDDIIDPADTDGLGHLAKVAWRALAALELRLEEEERLVSKSQ